MSSPLSIAFVWHMHQPYYRDMVTGRCSMPWVRLHATKDYLDMLKRLEPFPNLHQTFNIVPSLLDQLEEYLPPANQSDLFLELSEKPAAELTEPEQRFVLQWFFLAHPERMIKPHPRYHDLLVKRGAHVAPEQWPAILKRFRPQDYLDLQVWFNLVWIDPWLRRQDPTLAALETKGGHFSEAEKGLVLAAHRSLIAQIVPAYRAAAERGSIELTTSPYYHPIMPLLCETQAARMALPEVPMPRTAFRHPEDARWQLSSGLQRHEAAFGRRPRGLWPPEGSVSETLVQLAGEAGLSWIATDEDILWRTLKSPRSLPLLYRPHRLPRSSGQLAIVFRDRELSDLIGFVYSQWEPRRAITDFLKRLEGIWQQAQAASAPLLVTIILDGENAWESYPDDGHAFLTGLYEALARDDRFRCVTVSEFLDRYPLEQTPPLPELFSGSWIGGNFATWIGHPEKNAAWDRLVETREALEPLGREDPAARRAWNSFGAAEGSDWMWWFGDTHFSAQADEFDRLFRLHLANSYRLAGLPIPPTLETPIRRPAAFAMEGPAGPIHPTIDGRDTSYYEWLHAGRVDLQHQFGAMQRASQSLRMLYYGWDSAHQHLYLRLDVDAASLARLAGWGLELKLGGVSVGLAADGQGIRASTAGKVQIPCALHRILEAAIPRSLLTATGGEPVTLAIILTRDGELLERYPADGAFELSGSASESSAPVWSA